MQVIFKCGEPATRCVLRDGTDVSRCLLETVVFSFTNDYLEYPFDCRFSLLKPGLTVFNYIQMNRRVSENDRYM